MSGWLGFWLGSLQPIWDECSFTVAPDADESTIEIRVYAKRGPLGQSAALLGELLLGFQQVLATPNVNGLHRIFPLFFIGLYPTPIIFDQFQGVS